MKSISAWAEEHDGTDYHIVPLWSNYTSDDKPNVEITREFDPTHWALSLAVEREYGFSDRLPWGGVSWFTVPNRLWFTVQVGPFALVIRREWP